MECRNHPATAAADRCAGCMEPFCPNCMDTVRGQKYCGSCKVISLGGKIPVFQSVVETCGEAKEALKFSIFGLICLGIVLEPIAITKALKARQLIKANPNLMGSGKATAALMISTAGLILWILAMIAKFGAVGK